MRKAGSKIWRSTLLLLLISLIATGCGLSNKGKVTTLAVDENGVLTHTLIEPVEAGTQKEALEAFVEEEIEALYGPASDENAERPVTLESCSVSGKTAELKLVYQSGDDYQSFNGTTCFCGTIAEAEALGFETGRRFLDEEGQVADDEIISERAKEWKILIFEEPMDVRLPDKILYATPNVKITGRLTASLEADAAAEETASESQPDASGEESSLEAQENTESVADEEEAAAKEETDTSQTPVSEIDSFVINDFQQAMVIFK